MYGDTTNAPISGYQPSQDVVDFSKSVQKDYAIGHEMLHRPWTELNNRSVVDDENRGQRMFNAFVDDSVEDPAEAWKWRGTRSYARNKGIVMHANLTQNYLLGLFQAQNEDDEEDRDFSEIMRDIVEWMSLPTVSNYQSSFVQAVFGMLSNPVTYMGSEFCEVLQTIWEQTEDGKYTQKEVVDHVLSGAQFPIYSSTQVLLTNAYQRNIQKQRRIIKRRYVEKEELEAKYGEHPNWSYLQAGIKSIYSDEDGLFHNVKDDEHLTLVAEETVLSRRQDSEVCFLNGIYFGNDNVKHNPIKHRDNRGNPKYNITPFGYSRIGEHFFYYKSMMNVMGWDNAYYDAMTEIVMNRAVLEVEMPIAISGSDKVDSEIIFPNAVHSFENPETKISPLLPPSNMVAGFNALRETEKSMNEGTVNETVSGQLPDASQKAYSVAQAAAAAKKLIGNVGKSLAESIIQVSDLMKDIALNNYTTAQVTDLLGGTQKLKYRTFVLKKEGKHKTIKLDSSLIGKSMSKEDKLYSEYDMIDGKPLSEASKTTIIKANPERIAEFNYLARVDIEEMFPKNSEYWQPVLLNLKAALANDPYVNQEALTKKTLYSYFQSESDELINKNPKLPTTGQTPQTPFGSMVNNQQMASASKGAMV